VQRVSSEEAARIDGAHGIPDPRFRRLNTKQV
jgi:hypothetical protein